jgi:hypothetical protein
MLQLNCRQFDVVQSTTLQRLFVYKLASLVRGTARVKAVYLHPHPCSSFATSTTDSVHRNITLTRTVTVSSTKPTHAQEELKNENMRPATQLPLQTFQNRGMFYRDVSEQDGESETIRLLGKQV